MFTPNEAEKPLKFASFLDATRISQWEWPIVNII
jgi:hypothetical protein